MAIKFTGPSDLSKFVPGVPARDLTEAEYDRLTDGQKADVAKSGLYDLPKPKAPKLEPKGDGE